MAQKTIFDHLKQLTEHNNNLYYDNLSGDDKKTYNTYMITRFLSMNENWIDFVNYIQRFSYLLSPSNFHKMYNDILPKQKIFLKYIKSTHEKKYNKSVIEILKKHYELSESQCEEYYDIFVSSPQSTKELLSLVKSYGAQSEDYKKIEKDILKGV